MKKKHLIIVFGLLFGLVTIMFFVFTALRSLTPAPTPNPTPTDMPPITNAPQSTKLIPTIPLDEGGGVDLDAPTIERSIQEIAKVSALLPYSQQHALASGRTVDIIIASSETSSRPWVLPVFIGGIDYQVPTDAPGYEAERAAFREGAQAAFSWLADQNVNTSVIFINWGDRAFIQERAELWLE